MAGQARRERTRLMCVGEGPCKLRKLRLDGSTGGVKDKAGGVSSNAKVPFAHMRCSKSRQLL